MIKKSLFFFLAIFLFSLSVFPQKIIVNVIMDNKATDPQNDTIYYNINRPLTWNDFKGAPEFNHEGGAVTASGFAFNAKMDMAENKIFLTIWVHTFFSKSSSWKKPNINSAYHLLHEQHHFDITMISAEKFCNELLRANFTMNNYNNLLSDTFNKAFEENSVLQKTYDDETQHSINTKEQLRWNNKIDEELKSVVKNY